MIVVADSGPLMAFAKIDQLEILFRVFPKIFTPPAVHVESVVAGLEMGASDAERLQAAYEKGRIEIRSPREHEHSLPADTALGRGEVESILLALEEQADFLLLDDLAARKMAATLSLVFHSKTSIKGTLGVIVTAFMERVITPAKALATLEAIAKRADVWISSALCRKVADTIEREARSGNSGRSI